MWSLIRLNLARLVDLLDRAGEAAASATLLTGLVILAVCATIAVVMCIGLGVGLLIQAPPMVQAAITLIVAAWLVAFFAKMTAR